jgi:hypothetical protein
LGLLLLLRTARRFGGRRSAVAGDDLADVVIVEFWHDALTL